MNKVNTYNKYYYYFNLKIKVLKNIYKNVSIWFQKQIFLLCNYSGIIKLSVCWVYYVYK